MKLSQFRFKLAWFILGLSLVTVLGAYVTTVMFDATYFTATDTSVSLKGSLTNFAKLTTNAFQEAGSYQPAAGTLTNASTNAFTGAGLIVLQTAVPANQTNATLASLGGMAASAALTNLNDGIGTGLTNLLAAAVQAGQTNDGTGGWTATATNTSTLVDVGIGVATPSAGGLHIVTPGTGLRVAKSSGGDMMRVFPNASGHGFTLDAQNSAENTYEPFTFYPSKMGIGYDGYLVAGAELAINGAVGISTNAPSEMLEVVGNIKASGSLKLGTNILSFDGSNNLFWNGHQVTVTP